MTGLRVSAAPAEAGSKPSRSPSRPWVDDSAAAFDPAELLGDKPSSYARKGGSWAINAMRDTDRLPRNAVLAAAAPFGSASGTRLQIRIDHLDGTIGQGIGRFRIWVTDAANPLEGADLAPGSRKVLAVPRPNGRLLKPTSSRPCSGPRRRC